MKKLVSIFLLLILMTSLTGCPLDRYIDRIKGFNI